VPPDPGEQGCCGGGATTRRNSPLNGDGQHQYQANRGFHYDYNATNNAQQAIASGPERRQQRRFLQVSIF
jgi:hypothetical protein